MHKVHVFTGTYPGPPGPAALLRLLEQHVPHSLPLLRRLQFTRFPGGVTEHTRILFACSSGSGGGPSDGRPVDAQGDDRLAPADGPNSFAAAYVDFSRGPETEVWMYSSLEARGSELADQAVRSYSPSKEDTDEEKEEEMKALELDLAIAVLREIKVQRDAYDADPNALPRRERVEVLMGTLSERLRLAVVNAAATTTTGVRGGPTVTFPYVEIYDKWLMRLNGLPEIPASALALLTAESGGAGVGEDLLHWTDVRREDVAMVLSRTSIPRKERTIILLPSMALAKNDGTLVAWAFLGPDSSLTSLHCEPEYRGKGLAKAVAIKILKEHGEPGRV
ncbi:hypothetical protein Micbo1qcDRAFT_171892 [Microdochium bolleyi]|uniref:Uncharacterized protein n=1 Tax=Microdochium bolleyi TaxID=196109 RepID=A0A136JEH2_9PEZI|nr:hypothetical protein Micbo1qcDRAFT_171892 [Microdochium bolleyi]